MAAKRKKPVEPTVVFRRRYSGELSVSFWNVLNSLPDPDRTALYALGVALQDIEGRMLQFLIEAQDRRNRAEAAPSTLVPTVQGEHQQFLVEELYPCQNCGTLRTKAEGGTVFTICDTCWDNFKSRAHRGARWRSSERACRSCGTSATTTTTGSPSGSPPSRWGSRMLVLLDNLCPKNAYIFRDTRRRANRTGR